MIRNFIRSSIRWRLLFSMFIIGALFSTILILIHANDLNNVTGQFIRQIHSLNNALLIDQGRNLSHEIGRLLDYNIESARDPAVRDAIETLIKENADVVFVDIVDGESGNVINGAHREDAVELTAQKHDYDYSSGQMTTFTNKIGNETVIEFIEPIKKGVGKGCYLRLGISARTQLNELAAIQTEMATNTQHMIARSVRLSLLILLAGTLIILYVSGKLTAPVIELTQAVQRYSQGNFTTGAEIKSSEQGEVGKLSRAFNQMAGELQQMHSELRRTASEARQTGKFLDSIVENVPHMIFVKDARDLNFVLINKAGENMTGLSREKLIGTNDLALFPREQAEYFISKDREVLNSKRMLDISSEALTTSDGRVRYLHTKKVPLFGPDGNPQYLLGISEDITQLKSAEQERRLFFHHSLDLMCIASMDGYFEQVNPVFTTTLGYTSEELCSKPYLEFVHPDDVESTIESARMLNDGGTVVSFVNRYICKDGSIRWLTWNAGIDREFKKVFAVARDTTEQRKIEEQIVQAGLREQERIARDLHDGLGQILTGLAYKGKLIEQMLKSGEIPGGEQAAEIVRLANQASEQARTLARGLDPVVLKEGLGMALRDLAHVTEEVFGIECDVHVEDEQAALDKDKGSQLYRIAQEAVNNAVKHGKSKLISIYLTNDDKAATLVVMNQGTGLFKEEITSNGLGIQTMNYRAKLIGGALTIIPGPTGGVIVRCIVRKQNGANQSSDNRMS